MFVRCMKSSRQLPSRESLGANTACLRELYGEPSAAIQSRMNIHAQTTSIRISECIDRFRAVARRQVATMRSVLVFGPFRLDRRSYVLSKDGAMVPAVARSWCRCWPAWPTRAASWSRVSCCSTVSGPTSTSPTTRSRAPSPTSARRSGMPPTPLPTSRRWRGAATASWRRSPRRRVGPSRATRGRWPSPRPSPDSSRSWPGSKAGPRSNR